MLSSLTFVVFSVSFWLWIHEAGSYGGSSYQMVGAFIPSGMLLVRTLIELGYSTSRLSWLKSREPPAPQLYRPPERPENVPMLPSKLLLSEIHC